MPGGGQAKLPAGQQFTASYRMHWGPGRPVATDLAVVADTRVGQGPGQALRRFIIDFVGKLPPAEQIKLDASASAGKLLNVSIKPNPVRGGQRVVFDLDTKTTTLSELRATLTDGTKRISETWLYRWTA